jgi:hypothetical protein
MIKAGHESFRTSESHDHTKIDLLELVWDAFWSDAGPERVPGEVLQLEPGTRFEGRRRCIRQHTRAASARDRTTKPRKHISCGLQFTTGTTTDVTGPNLCTKNCFQSGKGVRA